MTENSPKVAEKFSCIYCDYICCKQSDYDKHVTTRKHKNSYNSYNLSPKVAKIYSCGCGHKYKYRQGLYTHRKSCTTATTIDTTNIANSDTTNSATTNSDTTNANTTITNTTDTNIINTLVNENKTLKEFMLEQNQDFKALIIELLKKETINNNIINNNNNISNCNNKSFNLNFFLNEQCKDALNINEFVDSIKMQVSDLEEFAHLGYANGVSNIFVKGINALDIHLRPIHCSDSKREVLYIKNNDEWIKETDDKLLIINAIKKVAFKNIKQINEWAKENPSCRDPRTKKYDQYNKIVMNAMSGVTEEEQKENIDKIVKNVTKAVAIDKYSLK